MKIVFFGNTGSGKTTVIGRLYGLCGFEIVAIDDCRKLVGDGTRVGETAAIKLFLDRIIAGKDQIIECVGVGKTARALAEKLGSTVDIVICITLLVSADICKRRVKKRPQDIPFPKDYELLDDFIERTQTAFQNGCLNKLSFNPLNTKFLYQHNTNPENPDQIAAAIVNLVGNRIDQQTPSADLSINDMLSEEIQSYYSNDYYSFQQMVNDRNEKIATDRFRIGEMLRKLSVGGNILDVGSGNAQWFSFLSQHVVSYYAVDVNERGLNLLPKDPRITAVKGNVFDDREVSLKKMNADVALLSFFLSHFSDQAINRLFDRLRDVRAIIIIDSFWSSPLKDKHLIKDLKYVRRNTTSRIRIDMPKRFFERDDILRILAYAGFDLLTFDVGSYWFVAFARKRQEELII